MRCDHGLRVLQVLQKPQRRGAELFNQSLSASLRRSGCTVATVYLYRHDGPARLPLAEDDVALDADERHPSERLGINPMLVRRLHRAIESFGPDLVQVNGGRTVKYVTTVKALTRPDWPVVYRNIGDPRIWGRGTAKRRYYRHLVLPRVDGVVAVSQHTLDGLRSIYGVTMPAIVAPRAIDTEEFTPARPTEAVRSELDTAPEAPVVVWAGALSGEKRPDRMVRVFAEARRRVPGLVLWVLGDGPLRHQLELDVAESGVESSVRILGVRADVADLLAASDLALLTSDTEGTPGIVLEAGSLGIPTVATRVGGVASVVDHGRTGLLADVDDEPGLADALVRLACDGCLRESLGRAARAEVMARFEIGTATATYIDFYRQILR